MSLSRFKTPLVTLEGSESLTRAAQAMRDSGVGCVVIHREQRPLGIVTDRDLVIRGMAAGRNPETTRIEELMTYDPVTIGVEEGIETAAKRMQAHGVRRLPLVDESGRVVGIVTADDLFVLLGAELGAICDAIAERVDSTESR